ncbi:ABC transporter ATP-binding protein [Phycicoccus endophyticus]|uniref:ABC transporter ATP-binding protein n=1 Tax=Phycicoccus endophyticus TaxID=1690220 RepID=A0A7G9R1B3_9MICO|nr:ABC transporter ATP-binding protein [Phycicoccus endophyticus]NHI18834.1 ABC transporter ATP-binding protein [Phycicoccus endophyticus]QNN49388.1 ABC transporter ATP-binding protein [Phycicoccus endophyticus]GGL36162.1 cobalamin/Fe3+-siderophore ABC transporter ATP-binding protein [Phycicoccus endophyticus]
MTVTDFPGEATRARVAAPAPLATDTVSLGYDGRVVVDGLSLRVPQGRTTVVVGPNGCGKSTLLRGLGRLLRPSGGAVLLDGEDIGGLPTREVARRVGLLPQQPVVPEGVTVLELVERGRHPHHGLFRTWGRADEEAVAAALERTDLVDLASTPVDSLSGGQRQRVWLALVLAQATPVLLLDEPTSFLDVAHQLDVLDLVRGLCEDAGCTVVMVLHDLGMAARYADHLVAMREGRVVAEGPPSEVVTPEVVEAVFGVTAAVLTDPESGAPVVVPRRRTS